MKNTLETSGEDVKATLETSGEDVKTTLETSGKDVKFTRVVTSFYQCRSIIKRRHFFQNFKFFQILNSEKFTKNSKKSRNYVRARPTKK